MTKGSNRQLAGAMRATQPADPSVDVVQGWMHTQREPEWYHAMRWDGTAFCDRGYKAKRHGRGKPRKRGVKRSQIPEAAMSCWGCDRVLDSLGIPKDERQP